MDDRELLIEIKRQLGEKNCLDDCAILPYSPYPLVISTDMLHELTDFPGGMTDYQIGWMAMAVTISDIAAMGAEPRYLTMAVGLDNKERLAGIVQGANACVQTFQATYVGGDIDSHTELTIVTTGIGYAVHPPVTRGGCHPGDLIGVTGILGRAQAGLAGFTQYWNNLIMPEPRVREGISLARLGATAMMDISDGLILSLYDILDASGYGSAILSDRLPVVNDIPHDEREQYALYGGGDFELLFTIPQSHPRLDGVSYTIIGEVINEPLILVDQMVTKKKGYLHMWK